MIAAQCFADPTLMCAALCGLYFVGRFDRQPLLMFSSAGTSACVAIITARTVNQAGRPAAGNTGIAFMYVFLVVFAFARTPTQSLSGFWYYLLSVIWDAFGAMCVGLLCYSTMSD